MDALPFDDSRRLTGPNLYFAGSGAVLETLGEGADDPAAWAGWRERVQRMGAALGWPVHTVMVRPHPGGAALAFTAPGDGLYAATEINEWAWLSQRRAFVLHAPGHPAAWDEASAQHTLAAMVADEANPRLQALQAQAVARGVPVLADDDALTLGLGEGGQTWPINALPEVADVHWSALHAIPTAMVTGTNGKTTTVRLLAAMLRAHGLRSGHSCTDGVFVAGEQIASGDFSGPGGARAVLRDRRVQAAVLETARGGMLRRGLVLPRVDAAAVTNVSDDHFGEYGIFDIDALVDAKLTVARALDASGMLVLNADDARLAARGEALPCRFAWFARDHDHPRLRAHRALGGATCGVRDGQLHLASGDDVVAIADITTMPLADGGMADYNLGNAAAASLLAQALGVPPATNAGVLSRFGSEPGDNPGRLQRRSFGGLRLLLDYAHNPEGLRGLLRVARAGGPKRLGLVLGQAGNRGDDDIRALAGVAADARPDLVVLKDIDGFIRGRETGEVAQVIGDELRRRGLHDDQLRICLPELGAVRELLSWSQPGDVLVLPIHALDAKAEVQSLLDSLASSGWQAGDPLA
ncbi:MAG: Mur ligase [Arenimonas sp.]|uniref:Mur ligase family protein n=1 Tax=Arenimonas sp. TaxID=1872635 RepID=UPI0025C5D08B|nr:Mur ligase family protein [Arenimonas sp.]MBW8368507.1 Mur ligase [Arenimonas sp.]